MTRKKRIATIAAIACMALFGLVYGFAFPATALAWDNCPKGLVNDPYPGACRRYVDTNADNICDLSQSEPVVSTTTTSVVTTTTDKPTTATTTALAATTTTSGEPPTGDCPLGPCLGCGACYSIDVATFASADASTDTDDTTEAAGAAALLAATNSANTTTTTPSSGGSDDSGTMASTATTVVATSSVASGGSSFLTHYLISPIAAGFFLIYGASFLLYKTKRIRVTTHRKIWNVLLLATFLITGIFGVILAIQLDYELPFTIPINLLFWHVEAGIVMTLISLFHMGWHFNYYRNLLRSSRSKVRAARAVEKLRIADERQLVLEAREQRRAEREASRAERETARGATARPGVVARRVAGEPQRAARAPRPWTDLDS